MSLTLALLTLDLSILPLVIHGLFILIVLRRIFFNKILPIFFFANFDVELGERSLTLSRQSSRDCNRVDTRMDSRNSDEKVQETEADGAEVESRKRQSLRKNSAFGSSASVQAKMSLDLIVEQLKREMSLKDIEAASKDDGRIKLVHGEMEVRSIAQKDSNVKSGDLVEKKLEEALVRKYDGEEAEKSLKEMSRCVTETTDLTLKDITRNLVEDTEESEIKDLHQRETTISSREPVDKVYVTEEQNLYGLIRSMIAAEVKRYEERERTMVRKVHSDTTDVGGRRTKKRKLSLLNNEYSGEIEKEDEDTNSVKILKGLELEERRNSPVDSVKSKVVTVNHRPSLNKENDASVVVVVDASTAFVLERKHDLGKSFGCRVEGRRINEGENVSSNESKEVSTNRETQTEREYTIRTVRSCPVRRRRRGEGTKSVLLDAQHQHCGLTEWIYRKASDNLIYEKGKASGSPSYVPLTQRFRWKYVKPRKAR